MSDKLQGRINRLFLPQRPIISKGNKIVFARDIVYLVNDRGVTIAVMADGKRYALPDNLNFYEKFFDGYFLRTHRSYLVALDRIEGTFERFPDEVEPPDKVSRQNQEQLRVKADECEISLRGTAKRVPVTKTYGKAVKKVLGISSFHYLVPEHPADKKLRQYGLIDFGWRELLKLNFSDRRAVQAYKDRWDIKKFSRTRMLSYFRQYGVNEINKKRVVKNIVYQMWRWIRAGIEEPSDGNIRSMWYRIKSVLAYHSNILESNDVNTFYSTLLEMIEKQGLFRYKDFGFMDMNAPYCEVNSQNPQIILASEKIGHFLFIRGLARAVGASFICTKGEPAVISMEYFSDDLHQGCRGKPLQVFCISDVDPAGYSIERNLVKRLEQNGHKIAQLTKLVDTSLFASDDIAVLRFPVVAYEKKGAVIKPLPPASMSQVTKSMNWFEELQDPRLITERDKGGGWKVITIWGVESDAADRKLIEERFKAGLMRLVRKKKSRGKS